MENVNIRYLVISLTFLLCAFFSSCSHKREGEIIKTQDGKFYQLEAAAPNEAYILREIDTSFIYKLSK